MRSLHVCNIANVAYGNCKLLRQSGHTADMRCHDLLHLMSQPEWDDLELCSDDFPDEFNFFNNKANFGSYRRPEWFQTPPILVQLPGVTQVKKVMPPRLKGYLRPLYRTLLMHLTSLFEFRKSPVALPERNFEERARELIELSKTFGPEWEVTHEMLNAYRPHAAWLSRQLQGHPVNVAYVISPIYAMIHGNVPFVSVEIGTMRDIPFDGTRDGKLLALAYRLSDQVVITNPDVVTAARRLGLERYRFCPHPVDEAIFCPPSSDTPLRMELRQRYDADFLLFAPARQNWEVKGNDRYLRAFGALLGRGVKAALIIPGWGQEVDRSKQLCQELGISARVAWVAPMSEMVMVKYYQAVDAVLDQFQLGVFGLITCKAMSCGQAVITSYDDAVHRWCFAEPPPLVPCRTEQDILEAMLTLHRDRGRARAVGKAARQWIERHHSKQVVCAILEAAMRDAIEHRRKTSNPKGKSHGGRMGVQR